MNLVVTDTCNRSCPYCFAAGKIERGTRGGGNTIQFADFVKAVDFFVRSGRKGVSLLGGEPTLHPRLPEMLTYLYTRKLHAHLFTNALVSEKRLIRLIDTIDRGHTSFLVNLNPPELRSRYENRRVDAFLREFGEISAIGVNVYRPDIDLGYAAAAFRKYKLKGRIRVGISHPSPGKNTDFLAIRDYPIAYRNIMRLVRDLDRMENDNVEVSIDCGFPLCLFSDEDLGLLYRMGPVGKHIGRCRPIIDIGTDLYAWPCYPLSDVGQISIEDSRDSRQLSERFAELFKGKTGGRFLGIFLECKDCGLRTKRLCHGGCHAYAFVGSPESRPVVSDQRKREIDQERQKRRRQIADKKLGEP